MLESGPYKIFMIVPTKGSDEEHLMGRFLIQNGQFFILEDHSGLLDEHLGDGPLTDLHEKALQSLMNSGYYKVVHENEINEGHHDSLIPELSIGDEDPEAEYILSEEGQPPQRVEIYGDVVIIDGQRIADEDFNQIMQQVHLGQKKLVPI